MGFSVDKNSIRQLHLNEIERRFSTFLEKESELPVCRVCFYSDDAFVPSDIMQIKTVNEFDFYSCSDGVVIKSKTVGTVYVHDNYEKIEVAPKLPLSTLQPIMNLIMRAYQYTCIKQNAMMIHSAAVCYKQNGILFCGLSGAGKSTQARLWLNHMGASPINFDQPCILYKENAAYVSGSPWSGKEGCFINTVCPIKAIVFVEQSNENRAELLPKSIAFSLIYLNNAIVAQNAQMQQDYSDIVKRIAETVPVYRLFCTMDKAAAEELHSKLYDEQT